MAIEIIEPLVRPFERVSEPGSTPGTIVAVPEDPKPVMHVIGYSKTRITEGPLESLDGLRELTEQYAVTWVNVDGLGDADVIRKLGSIFGLHRLALEDVVNLHQRPKVEEYSDHLFIVARMIDASERLRTEQICFFVGNNFILTFQEGLPGDCLEPVRRRIQKSSGRLRNRGTDYLTYALLDSIIDHYFPVVEAYGERLDELDDDLMNSQGDASIAAIHRFRSELLLLRRAIRPHREVINELMRSSQKLVSDETRIYLRDCYDHTIQLSEAIDTYRETCSDLRDFHLAAISNHTNDAMKTLTVIATIFIPLSFIAGLYGMNFDHMPELHWQYGYPFVLSIMTLVVVGFVLWMRRKGW